jgi:hypothetical protein
LFTGKLHAGQQHSSLLSPIPQVPHSTPSDGQMDNKRKDMKRIIFPGGQVHGCP